MQDNQKHNESKEPSHLFHPKLRMRDLQIPGEGPSSLFKATEAERASLATFLNVISVESLELEVFPNTVKRDTTIDVHFVLKAHYTQKCVNTAVPLPQSYEGEFDVRYVSPELHAKMEAAYFEDLINHGVSSEDDFEMIQHGFLDVGDIAIQYLVLEIEVFPKIEMMDLNELNEAFDTMSQKFDTVKSSENPFKKLENLKIEKKS